MSGVTACSESAGPEQGAVTAEELQRLEQNVTELEERVNTLEAGEARAGEDVADATDDLFRDAPSLIGDQVTVSAEVADLVATSNAGTAFRIGEDSAEPIAVISAQQPPQLDENDVVRVSGTVKQLKRAQFEQDFGVAADDLFEDADAFFEAAEGKPAIAANQIEVLQEKASS